MLAGLHIKLRARNGGLLAVLKVQAGVTDLPDTSCPLNLFTATNPGTFVNS